MELQDTKKLNDLLQDLCYPGQLIWTIAIQGDKALLNGEEMGSIEAVNRTTSKLIPIAMECTCFENSSWLKNGAYEEDFNNIMQQTEEDYMFDMEILNFITCLKVAANKGLKNDKNVYFGAYDSDTGITYILTNEEILEEMKSVETNGEEYEEE